MKKLLLVSICLITSTLTISQTNNEWVPNGNGSWMTPANWSLGHIPMPAEKVVIDKSKNVLISDVPTTSISQLEVKNAGSKTVTLEAEAAGNVLTITGGPGADLDLTDPNVVLNLTGDLDLVLEPGVTAEMEKTFSGHNVTVKPNATFTIHGNGTPSFTARNLFIKADASGIGSIVINSTSNPIFVIIDTTAVEQHLTAGQWHFISSPVTDATTGVFVNDYLRSYDEPAGDWSPFIVPTDPPLATAVGYEVWSDDTETKVFEGDLNSGDHTASLTRSWIPNWAPADTNGWNLVGNPYPSAVDWQSDDLTLTHVDPTIYYWNGSSYVSYNRITHLGSGSRYIPPMQAFFVHVTRDMNKWTTGEIGFTNASRVDISLPLYKESPVINNLLTLRADGNGYSDLAMISFNDSASGQFDWQLDNMKLEGNANVPHLYSELADGTRISVNSLPFEGNLTGIPVSFTCGAAGSYSITAGSLGSFDPSVQITLKDLLANTVQDLRSDSVYTFNHDPQFSRHRFLIQVYNPVTGENETPAGNDPLFTVWSDGGSVYVKHNNPSNITGFLSLTDMLGREIFRTGLVDSKVAEYPANVAGGYYVATVCTGQTVVNQKVYLR